MGGILKILRNAEFNMKLINIIKSFLKPKTRIQDLINKFDNLEKIAPFLGIPLQIELPEITNDFLEQRILALNYRLEKFPLKFHRKLFELLREEAKRWKEEQAIITTKNLNLSDLKELKVVACHGPFAELILKSESLKHLLFNWILRDQNEAEVFIQFPSLIDRLNDCKLNGRLSCHGCHLLKIKKYNLEEGIFQKIVTLPFEGRLINILDESQTVDFRGGVRKTVAEVFEVFKNKDFAVGDFEFMKEGIINWNIHHLGYWDDNEQKYIKIELDHPNWWEQLPFFEVLSSQQVKLRYGWAVNGANWIAAASATRGLASLSYEQTHAFLELAIPLGKGMYGIYDFGKLAYKYPCSLWEMLDMFCKNVHATIAFPDENVFYSHRQHALHAFNLTAEQGIKLMTLIKQDIQIARSYNMIYQIESENCAKWVQLKLEAILGKSKVPNLYRMKLLNTEPDGPVSKIFAVIKKLPESWQVPLLTTLHLPLGAAKETWIEENGVPVAKSLKRHSFFNTGEVYLPAFMHDQLLRGSLKCPLGVHHSCFAVGLLSYKHKFSYIQTSLFQKGKWAIDRDCVLNFFREYEEEKVYRRELLTPLKL